MLYKQKRIFSYIATAVCAAALFLGGMLLGAALDGEAADDVRNGEPQQSAQSGGAPAASQAPLQTQQNSLRTPAPTDAPAVTARDVDSIGEQSVLPTTAVVRRYSFSQCGHVHEVTGGSGELAGKTRAEVSAACGEFEIAEFSGERVVLARNIEGFCPTHFLLKLEGGALMIIRTDPATLVPYEYRRLGNAPDGLPDDAEKLALGLLFDDEKSINEYVENLES